MRYNRDEEGFAKAFETAKWLAKNHPKKKYVLFVSKDRPNEYCLTLSRLFDPKCICTGTAANFVDEHGTMSRFNGKEMENE